MKRSAVRFRSAPPVLSTTKAVGFWGPYFPLYFSLLRPNGWGQVVSVPCYFRKLPLFSRPFSRPIAKVCFCGIRAFEAKPRFPCSFDNRMIGSKTGIFFPNSIASIAINLFYFRGLLTHQPTIPCFQKSREFHGKIRENLKSYQGMERVVYALKNTVLCASQSKGIGRAVS